MSPSYVHAYIHTNLITLLAKLEGFTVFTELTIFIDGKDYTPDISIYHKRPVNLFQDVVRMEELPLVAIEILSPTQGTQEILDKWPIYFPAGIQSCWLVVPAARTITVFSSPDHGQSFTESDVVDKVLGTNTPINEVFG